MNQIYIDTSCIIYLLEAVGPFHEPSRRRSSLRGWRGSSAAPSPLRDANFTLLARYESFFGARRFSLIDVAPLVEVISSP